MSILPTQAVPDGSRAAFFVTVIAEKSNYTIASQDKLYEKTISPLPKLILTGAMFITRTLIINARLNSKKQEVLVATLSLFPVVYF